MNRIIAALLAVAFVTVPAGMAAAPAMAQAVQPSGALKTRTAGLVAILNGQGDYDSYFSAPFRAQVPKAQFDAIGQQLKSQFGNPVSVESITPGTPDDAVLRVGYERGVVTMRIAVDPTPPNVVTGLLITGSEARGDSAAKLEQDFRALPGQSGVGIYALDGGVAPVMAVEGDRVAPLGSAFKLWVLAELARQVKAGERRWSDVVTLPDLRSMPSGMTQNWPKDAPVTLHTLATLMISISDNTATDTLVGLLGRAKIEAMVATAGTLDAARNRPFLTTRDAFALKGMADDPVVKAWGSASADARAAGFARLAPRIAATPIDPGMFAGGKPLALQIEWFASPADEARTLDWLRRNADQVTLDILAVNPGGAPKDRFAYVGFKGGSEPGVITLNYLVRTKAGKWFAVTGNWHRDDADVETLRFTTLMSRALALVPQG